MYCKYIFLLLPVFYNFQYITCSRPLKKIPKSDDRYGMGQNILQMTVDVIKYQNTKMYMIRNARIDNSETPAFEIGYMVQMIQEHYRKMLDKWRSTKRNISTFYGLEVVLHLEEIEHLYWSIKHEVYMLHEIERKYKVKTQLNDTYIDPMYDIATPWPSPPPEQGMTRKPQKPFKQQTFLEEAKYKNPKGGVGAFESANGLLSHVFGGPYTTRTPKKKYFPVDYGWDLYEWNSDT